jgi:hypothetical protein
LGVSLVVGSAACGQGSAQAVDSSGLPTNRPVTEGDLQAFEVTHLVYPGSRLLTRVGADQTPTRPGEEPNPAYIGAILVATATSTQLYAWYDRQLTAKGYEPAPDYRLSSESSGQAWQIHKRLQVQVGVFTPAGVPPAAAGEQNPAGPGQIVYEALLVGYPPGLPDD